MSYRHDDDQRLTGSSGRPMVIEYPFKRTTGPVIGAFLTGLREQVLVGIKGADGRVLVPPAEYDPITGEDLTEMVEVGPARRRSPRGRGSREPHAEAPARPSRSPGRWSRLDGADTAMLRAVDAGSHRRHVAPACGSSPAGPTSARATSHDLECFEPEAGWPTLMPDDHRCPASLAGRRAGAQRPHPGRSSTTSSPPARPRPASCGASAEKKIIGERCPECGKVYVPPRGADPELGVPTAEQVELAHVGTVTAFCVVNVPFYGQGMEIPYTSAR